MIEYIFGAFALRYSLKLDLVLKKKYPIVMKEKNKNIIIILSSS